MTREEIEQKIRDLIGQLSCTSSPYGDWKNLKQLDTNEYTEEEMAEYRQGRANIRARIAELEAQLETATDDYSEG